MTLKVRANHYRPWSASEQWTLEDHIEAGHPYKVVAKKLRRSPQAVADRAYLLGIGQRQHPDRLTTAQVRALFGITIARYRTWLNHGWLTPSRAHHGRYHRMDILAFIENSDTWVAWKPEQITDAELRSYAQDVRQDAPRWLTVDEVAQALGYSYDHVVVLLRRGVLQGKKVHSWFIREDHVAAFVPPCER